MQTERDHHEANVTVVNEHGMHARPATRFVELANTFESDIRVSKSDGEVDGKSVLEMLTLGAPCGTTLRIRANGTDAARAVKELADLIASGFPEFQEGTGPAGIQAPRPEA